MLDENYYIVFSYIPKMFNSHFRTLDIAIILL